MAWSTRLPMNVPPWSWHFVHVFSRTSSSPVSERAATTERPLVGPAAPNARWAPFCFHDVP